MIDAIPELPARLRKHPALWILLVGALLYAPSLRYGYTFFDDNNLILERLPRLSRLSFLKQAFLEDAFHSAQNASRFYYRPLLTASLSLDAQWPARSPWPYHATNILLHLAAALLFLRLLQALGASRRAAGFCALIFTVHPAFSQAVAWIPGRNDSLLAVFVFSSTLFFLKFLEEPKGKFLGAHLGFLALALLTKEAALALPLPLFALCWIRKGRPKTLPWTLATAWTLVIIPWLMLHASVLSNPASFNPKEMASLMAGRLPDLFSYLAALFLPTHLSVYPVEGSVANWPGFAAGALMAAMFVLSPPRKRPRMLFGLLWFLAFLLPSMSMPDDASGHLPLMYHRAYVPFLGLALFLSEGLSFIGDGTAPAARVGGCFLAAMLFIAARAHLPAFRDPISFWTNAVRTSPFSAFARNNLGAMYFLRGGTEQAESEWHKAVELNPEEKLAHGNLGLVMMNKGRWAEAEREFLAEMAINPLYDNAPFNLGLLYAKAGKTREAVALWEKTVAINPGYKDAYANLIVTAWNAGDKAAALEYLKRARSNGVDLPDGLESLPGSPSLPSPR